MKILSNVQKDVNNYEIHDFNLIHFFFNFDKKEFTNNFLKKKFHMNAFFLIVLKIIRLILDGIFITIHM